jgi:glycosyltransferase involved in cell wall biosynthesis
MVPSNMITVITRAYNAEKYIGEALQSVLENLNTLREEVVGEVLVCYDRGSHDNTYSILKQFYSKYPEFIHIIEHEHMSAPEALIYCLKKAQGTYIFLLDYDDLYPREHVRRAVSILRNHPKAFGFTKVYFMDDVTKRLIGTSKIPKNPIDIINLLKGNYIGTSSICMLNKCVREVLALIERLPKSIIPFIREDWLIALLAFKECTPIFISDSYVLYRLHTRHRSAIRSTDSLRLVYDCSRDIVTLLAFAKLERNKLSTFEWKALEQGLMIRLHTIVKNIGKDFNSLTLFATYYKFVNMVKHLVRSKETG